MRKELLLSAWFSFTCSAEYEICCIPLGFGLAIRTLIYYIGLFGDLCVPVYCFCSGYAHYLLCEKNGTGYAQRIPGKILRFLLNYWIVVILFSTIGLLFDKTNTIPGSFAIFLGNMLVVGMSYNGAWWFVTTYLFLLLLSPASCKITAKVPGAVLTMVSGSLYFVAYLLRFNFQVTFENSVANWLWIQFVLLGTSQFPYFIGMLAFRYRIPEKLRAYFVSHRQPVLKGILALGLPMAAFISHGIVQSVFVAPFTAMTVMLSLTIVTLPGWCSTALSYFGKHSTNIWLTHMFFYLTVFPGLVFKVRYPVFIVLYMFVICFGASYVIDFVYRPICRKIG